MTLLKYRDISLQTAFFSLSHQPKFSHLGLLCPVDYKGSGVLTGLSEAGCWGLGESKAGEEVGLAHEKASFPSCGAMSKR